MDTINIFGKELITIIHIQLKSQLMVMVMADMVVNLIYQIKFVACSQAKKVDINK